MELFLMKIVEDAVEENASDIHFNKMPDGNVTIFFRIGGAKVEYSTIKNGKYDKLLSFIRYHSAMDFSHPMQPQSGSLVLENESGKLNCRVSILPTHRFRSLVLRVVNESKTQSLEDIPYFHENVLTLKKLCEQEAGLILIGGPTGSGKTTTAYAMIEYLKNHLQKNVITIEDPIEYRQTDIIQMQVNEKAGMDYEVGIKAVLRHDPDVIVIGEIRDLKTAKNAIRAALTGHLVISTIHARDNIGNIHRLLDLGFTKNEISQVVSGLVNQRLVKSSKGKKALFEITTDDNLENLFEQFQNDEITTVTYTTLDEEFLKWKSIDDI